MPIYTFKCVDCDTEQDVRVDERLSEGDMYHLEFCCNCMGMNLKKIFTKAAPSFKGLTTPGRHD